MNEIFRKEVIYSGHLITQNGLKPNHLKTKTIKIFPEPEILKEIKSFPDLAGYYRRIISNFAKFSRSLKKSLQKDVQFHFKADFKNASEALKKTLVSDPIPINRNFDDTFSINNWCKHICDRCRAFTRSLRQRFTRSLCFKSAL